MDGTVTSRGPSRQQNTGLPGMPCRVLPTASRVLSSQMSSEKPAAATWGTSTPAGAHPRAGPTLPVWVAASPLRAGACLSPEGPLTPGPGALERPPALQLPVCSPAAGGEHTCGFLRRSADAPRQGRGSGPAPLLISMYTVSPYLSRL